MKTAFFISFLMAVYTTVNCQENYIAFGSGGGYSGMATVYKLAQNGKVLKGTGKVDIKYTESGKFKKSQAKKIFAMLNNIETDAFSHPGNMYYFISYFKNGAETKYTWGASDFQVPEELSALYRETISKLSKLDFQPVQNN